MGEFEKMLGDLVGIDDLDFKAYQQKEADKTSNLAMIAITAHFAAGLLANSRYDVASDPEWVTKHALLQYTSLINATNEVVALRDKARAEEGKES